MTRQGANFRVNNIVIIGGNGAIGQALTRQLAGQYPQATLTVFSRRKREVTAPNIKQHVIDYTQETSLAEAAALAAKDGPLDRVIVATGILHSDDFQPEKALRDLSAEKFQRLFEANTILPALLAKHFLPKLNRQNRAIFAAISARVGSISDNRLGGWYSYRASKAALNMILKNAAIETARRNKQAIIVGLHPGTVDSNLSKPFQGNVPMRKLFTPDFSALKLLEVLETLTPNQSGKCFAWDGGEVEP